MKHLVIVAFLLGLPGWAYAQASDSTALFGQLDSLRTLGAQLLSGGKATDAEQVYRQMAELSRQQIGTQNKYYWKALHGQGVCKVRAGKYDQGETFFSEARDIALAVFGERSPEYSESVYRLGQLALERKRFDTAETLLQTALQLMAKGSSEYASALNALCILYIQTGRLEAAESVGLEGLAINEKLAGKQSAGYTMVLTNVATVYKEMAEFEKSEKMYLESRELRGKLLGTKHPDYAQSLQNLAALYADMGRFEEAEPLYLEAKGILLEQFGSSHPKYAITLGNLGNVYLQTGRHEAAGELYREVLEIRKKTFGPDNPQCAITLTILGKLYNSAGRFAEAEAALTEAMRIYEKEPDPQKRHYHYANTVFELGDTYSQQGKAAEAEPLLIQAKDIGEKRLGTEHTDYLTSILGLADFYARTGNTAQAGRYFREGFQSRDRYFQKAERYFSENDLLSLHKLRASEPDKLYNFLHRFPAGSELRTEAFDFALHYKNSLLENRVKWKKAVQTANADTRKVYFDWMALRRRIAAEYAKPLADRTALATLEEQANALEKLVTERLGPLPGSEARPDWQDVRSRLKPGEAAIEFVGYQRAEPGFPVRKTAHCGALILRPDREVPLFVPLFSARDAGSLQATRRLYAFKKENSEANLHELVWLPLSRQLENVRTLYFSPAGLLHRINLGAIPTSETETIGDRFDLHNLSSTRQLAAPAIQNEYKEMDAVIFGGIDYAMEHSANAEPTRSVNEKRGLSFAPGFRSLGIDEWPYLEWTLREAETTKSIWEQAGGKTHLFSARAATEAALKQIGRSGSSPRVLHLATHGYFFPDADSSAATGFQASTHPLMRSGLILAGANEAWKGNPLPEGQEDGILTAYEIAQLDLSRTELVVLSACETGLGDLIGNEGVFGLQRAFKMAGAKYVLMSLWKVSDQKAYEFMETFYRDWLERGRPIPSAFQLAQNAMRKKYERPFNPALWAGFVLIQ